MPSRKRWVAVAFAGAVATVSTTALAGSALAQREDSATLTPVDAANEKAPGLVTPNTLSPEFAEVRLAEGARKLENPDGTVRYYGYLANEPMVPLPGTTAEAQKTEPDKNTYLVLDGQHGADAAYDYGTHFVYQGHEGGTVGSITRINLDADGKHRVTLLATKDAAGAALPTFDGSTWDPWANRLLFTAEGGAKGGVWQATPDLPSKVEDISGALGRGGYEGIQNDSDGNIWMVEDVGGPKGTANPHARQPNSFVYRFVPKDRADLTAGGRLQALQVLNASGRPIVYGGAANVDSDIRSADTKALHTYGGGLQTKWVTVHDTATDPTSTGFDANALAKTAKATPFKRPENGVFQPGTGFRRFFFTETGDTDALTEAGPDHGGFGGVQVLEQGGPSADTGLLKLFFNGDKGTGAGDTGHTGFDNIQFATKTALAVVEDRGDTLHTQLNALDSGFLLDTSVNHGAGGAPAPLRFLAEGRDPSATIDSALSGTPGFTNDGDNEITGFHVSDGDPTPGGILGAKDPRPFGGGSGGEGDRHGRDDGWRVFWTQQHGDNMTYEITLRP